MRSREAWRGPACLPIPSCAAGRTTSYLRDLLCLLPSHPKHRVLELAPAYWRATSERPDTQQRLAHNHFRAAVLRLQP